MRQHHDFFSYARERHNIYLQRRDGDAAPWTTDPVLQSTGFTNVFRELDRVTVWFRQHIRDRLGPRDVVPATAMFRWFNRITTGEVIERWLLGMEAHVPPFDGELLEGMIRREIPRGPWVTGSYMVHSPYGMDKLTGMIQYCQEFYDWWGEAGQYAFLRDDDTPILNMQAAHEALLPLNGLSGFTAYEVVTDLRYTGAILIGDRNHWAHAGPGATRGGSRVMFGNHTSWSQSNRAHQEALRELMRALLKMSRSEAYWPQDDPDWPRWEMREVEHTLCEYDKYERVRREQGQAKRVFNAFKAGPLPDAGLGGL